MAQLFSGKFTLSPDVISEQYLEETMLLNVKTLVYVKLDALAGCLWHLLEKHDDFESVFTELKNQQNMPEEQLHQFLNTAIGNFQRARFITLS